MSYVLKTNLSNRNNYGGNRSTSAIKYIPIHYTANDGDTDEANGNYFNKNIVNASAHYFIDDDSVTNSVPDNYVAYAVGGSKYKDCSSTGGGKFYGKCTNANSLSIELCDTVKNQIIYPSQKTINNAIDFCKMKMVQYGINKAHVIRHFDVNGKRCPCYWCATSKNDSLWKTEFLDKLSGWVLFNSKWYWLDENGDILKNNWINSKGKWYYLESNGIMSVNKWIHNNSGTWSYVNSDGAAVTGWNRLFWNGVESWYYFDENGNMLNSIWIHDNGKDYYLSSSGAMATDSYIASNNIVYYWVGSDGAWQKEWDTKTPNLGKYRVVK